MWRNILRLSAITALGLTLLPGSAVSEQKSLRVGFESHEARAMRRTRSMTEAA
jgi:hypothetical protein